MNMNSRNMKKGDDMFITVHNASPKWAKKSVIAGLKTRLEHKKETHPWELW